MNSPRFAPQRLHSRGETAWAVVRADTGAIALRDDKLLMRLTETEATTLSVELSAAVVADKKASKRRRR